MVEVTSADAGGRAPAPLAQAPFLRHGALAVRSGREVTAGPQDARLSGDQAALRARDPAGRSPEREDAVPLPLCVARARRSRWCSAACRVWAYMAYLPSMLEARSLVVGAASSRVGAGAAGRVRPWPAGARHGSQAATSVFRGRPRGRLRGTTSPRRNSSPPQTPHGSRRSRAPEKHAIL